MSEIDPPPTAAVWVVRVWREDTAPSEIRARVTTANGSDDLTSGAAHTESALASPDAIIRSLSDFLDSFVSGNLAADS